MLKISKNNLQNSVASLVLLFGLILIPIFDMVQAASPNLSITNSVNKTQVVPGEILTFTLSYQNTGQGNATGVKIINNYSTTYLEMYDAGGGSVSVGQISWDIGTFSAGSSGSKIFKLKVKNNITSSVRLFNTGIINSNETTSIQSNTIEINVNISQTNNPPVANAGPDREVYENQSIALNGSNSYDPDGNAMTFSWYCPVGTLSNPNISQPTFIAPSVNYDTNCVCALTVTDNKGLSSSDTVQILIKNTDGILATIAGNIINIEIETTIKNLSRGDTVWQNEISATPLDIVKFQIKITSNSNIHLNNIMIKNTLPAKMFFQQNSLKINDVSDSRDIVSQTINIGNMAPSQIKIITFNAQIVAENNFTFGTTNLINTALVYNESISKTGTATIAVKKAGVLGASTISTGITDNLLLNSILFPLMISLFLVWIFKSQLLGLDQLMEKRKAEIIDYRAKKLLTKKIEQLKRKLL